MPLSLQAILPVVPSSAPLGFLRTTGHDVVAATTVHFLPRRATGRHEVSCPCREGATRWHDRMGTTDFTVFSWHCRDQILSMFKNFRVVATRPRGGTTKSRGVHGLPRQLYLHGHEVARQFVVAYRGKTVVRVNQPYGNHSGDRDSRGVGRGWWAGPGGGLKVLMP